MTKAELRSHLLAGKVLTDLFQFRTGQGCQIVKAPEFRSGDEILYIPDLSLRDVSDDAPITGEEDVEEVLSCCYTGDDIIQVCGGDLEMARRLFDWCDWQSPDAAAPEVFAAYADDPAPAFCG